jgi:hypothetical protein
LRRGFDVDYRSKWKVRFLGASSYSEIPAVGSEEAVLTFATMHTVRGRTIIEVYVSGEWCQVPVNVRLIPEIFIEE